MAYVKRFKRENKRPTLCTNMRVQQICNTATTDNQCITGTDLQNMAGKTCQRDLNHPSPETLNYQYNIIRNYEKSVEKGLNSSNQYEYKYI